VNENSIQILSFSEFLELIFYTNAVMANGL